MSNLTQQLPAQYFSINFHNDLNKFYLASMISEDLQLVYYHFAIYQVAGPIPANIPHTLMMQGILQMSLKK